MTRDQGLTFFNGNVDAFRMCEILSYAANLWDDIIDRDKEIPEALAHQVFSMMLLELPANKFYREHIHAVLPMMMAASMEYRASREYEKAGDEHALELAFGMRYSIGIVATYAATVCGATPQQIAEMHRMARPERMSDYKKDR